MQRIRRLFRLLSLVILNFILECLEFFGLLHDSKLVTLYLLHFKINILFEAINLKLFFHIQFGEFLLDSCHFLSSVV